MRKKIKVFCTIGPATLKNKIISKLEKFKIDLLRINLSHTKIDDLKKTIIKIKRNSKVPICIDTEGAQIRNGELIKKKIFLKEGKKIYISSEELKGSSLKISFYPPGITKKFKINDEIKIDFDQVVIKLIQRLENGWTGKVINEGFIGQNKATNLKRKIKLPSITKKDEEAIKIALKMGINFFSYSFASSKKDVVKLRKLIGARSFLISKIESIQGIKNLKDIIIHSDAILIDRGDLSREIAIEKIPIMQRQIIKMSNNYKKPVYVATNLLETMITKNYPNRAEVNDIISSLEMGANGLVLAAETAIGKYPISAVVIINKLILEIEKWKKKRFKKLNSIKI